MHCVSWTVTCWPWHWAGAGWLAYRTPMGWWRQRSTILYFLGLALLLLVFVPGLGREANGALRWVAAGPLSLQTSEFMKVFVVLYMSGYLVRRQFEAASSLWASSADLPAGHRLFTADAATRFRHHGGVADDGFRHAVSRWRALWQFAALLSLAVGAMTLVWISPYHLERVTTFNPWGMPRTLAISWRGADRVWPGEWVGVGLGNGIQTVLPAEAHTDFVMAVIGESSACSAPGRDRHVLPDRLAQLRDRCARRASG